MYYPAHVIFYVGPW